MEDSISISRSFSLEELNQMYAQEDARARMETVSERIPQLSNYESDAQKYIDDFNLPEEVYDTDQVLIDLGTGIGTQLDGLQEEFLNLKIAGVNPQILFPKDREGKVNSPIFVGRIEQLDQVKEKAENEGYWPVDIFLLRNVIHYLDTHDVMHTALEEMWAGLNEGGRLLIYFNSPEKDEIENAKWRKRLYHDVVEELKNHLEIRFTFEEKQNKSGNTYLKLTKVSS